MGSFSNRTDRQTKLYSLQSSKRHIKNERMTLDTTEMVVVEVANYTFGNNVVTKRLALPVLWLFPFTRTRGEHTLLLGFIPLVIHY